MKLRELEALFNESLKSLRGIKVNASYEFHKLKEDALTEVAKKFGFNVTLWSLELELGNDVVLRSDERIFKITFDLKQDKRHKYEMVGTIENVEVELVDEMKCYADIDIENLNSFYVRDSIKGAIAEQKEIIQQKLQKLKEEELTLAKYEKEYERVEKEVLSLSL